MGFEKTHSNHQAILELTNNIGKAIGENKFMMCVFLNLSKAFDTIDHGILLAKLIMKSENWPWTDSEATFVTKFSTSIKNGYRSDQKPVRCGVPQG